MLLLTGLAGCGSGAPAYPPTGVDGLQIPTVSPAPQDFVASVDNPWFPVLPGTRWVYRTAGSPFRTTVVAAPGPVVDGVPTAMLTTTETGSAPIRDYYAQDRAGNVWWFGRAGEWRAGGDVGPGLAMPAAPRRGDGYWMADLGDVSVHGVVVDTDRAWDARIGSTEHAVVIEVVRGSTADVETFSPGIGMVRKGQAGLVSYTSPARS
ncbi:MAG TPA: hypothetical protein VJ872_13435 [Nocardioides sp.]|nr:hypothetical protein [Nocardioides sp.]